MKIKVKWMIGSLCMFIDNCLYVVGHCMVIGVLIALVAFITTIPYHTEQRAFWDDYILCVGIICIFCAATSFLNFILVQFAAFPPKLLRKLQKRSKIYYVESAIIIVLYFISGPSSKVDLWLYQTGRTIRFIAWCILFARGFQSTAYENIKNKLLKITSEEQD